MPLLQRLRCLTLSSLTSLLRRDGWLDGSRAAFWSARIGRCRTPARGPPPVADKPAGDCQQSGDRDVGRPRCDLQESAHHLRQAGEVDPRARPRLAVAEQQQVVQRLHGRGVAEPRRELSRGGGVRQVLREVWYRDDIDLSLVHEAGGTRRGQRHRVDGVVEGRQHAESDHRSAPIDRWRPASGLPRKRITREGCSVSARRSGAATS